jgi:hypothetical protein
VVGEVLDLVRDRAAVDLAQTRIGIGECLPVDIETEEWRRDARLELGGQLRDQALGLSRYCSRRSAA